VPPFYIEGDRVSAVYHARIRNKCSNLNSDLFTNHLTISAACDSGSLVEDADHFLIQCQKYALKEENYLQTPENSIKEVYIKRYYIGFLLLLTITSILG
jgi:hypothetical protein